MAQKSVKLYPTKWGYVDEYYPNTVMSLPSSPELMTSSPYHEYLYFGFDALPSDLTDHTKLITVKAKVQVEVPYASQAAIRIYPAKATFTKSTLTYNNRPTPPTPPTTVIANYIKYSHSATGGPVDATLEDTMNTTDTMFSALAKCFTVANTAYIYGDDIWVYYPKLTGGGNLYIELYYDPAVKVKSYVSATSYPSGSSVASNASQTFKWEYKRDGSYFCKSDTWTQSSAKIYWKKSTASSWNTISISGTSLTKTVAANTFPSGSTIQWYISGTDTDGTTTTTATRSFTTIASQITADSYPSGTSVDSRSAWSFTWHFASSAGNFTQTSAKLLWRVSGTSSWNTVNASGSTQSLSVAGYTFPHNSTIEWYLSGTDVGGYTSTTETATFKTQQFSLAAATFPSGSNVDTRSAITFSWTLKNTTGAATQKSAKLYWRVQNAASYTAISNATATKSMSVAANTFPTGKTIQWYLEVVAADNTTLTTSATTFTTVSPQITATSYPTGNGKDTRVSYKFEWKFTSAVGDYNQTSAVFYWKTSTEQNYRSVNASGSTKSVTIAANTFPVASTIQWYVSGVDVGGRTSQTSVASFTTATPNIVVTSSPATSNVDTRSAITFKWEWQSEAGNYVQTSGTFYWRVSGESSYRSVSAGTNTQVTIAANTFPTASTIQWYVSGVASGRSNSTSAKTFTTVTPNITIVDVPSGSNKDTREALTFSWKFASNAGNHTQQSATFYWRVSGESNYRSITASGSTTSVTVPANTFPTASTIQWYVSGTEIGGHSSSTTATTFSTATPNITATSVPTGSNVDTRSAITIKWAFQSAVGNYAQQSATFYWRVSGASSYTAVAASGSTTQVTVPANTFPTGSTIQWYLAGVDSSGRSSQTNATTFNTATPKITATQYPSGQNVYSGADIVFKWTLTSAVGNHEQQSAALYYRYNTSDPYTSISASGSTTEISVPANTFGTNKTVYWYLSGTDIGGYTSTTTATSFKTSTTQITPQAGPTDGYVNPRNAITFSWYFAANGGAIPQQSATFYWKLSTASNYTAVAASGSTTSVTIAANTFPTGKYIDWYISGTDIGGTSSTSQVYTLSTAASQTKTIAKYPTNGIVDGSNPITFQWIITSEDGYPASKVRLQWRLPTETEYEWHTITEPSEAITSYTVAANYFQPGQIYWRVSAWNVDETQGPESVAVFVCMIAPTVSSVSADAVPFTTIRWQASDQQSYEIDVDGKTYGPYFGTEKQFALPTYLEDGTHTIKVRVLGSLNLWSNWTTAGVDITNTPGDTCTLNGTEGTDANLTWETESATADFLVYRDGLYIGHTGKHEFVDRFALGEHEYHVINRLANNNYTMTNVVTLNPQVDCLTLAPLSGGEWVKIIHAQRGKADPDIKQSVEVTYNRLVGYSYPSPSVSEFMDMPVSCSAVFLYTETEAHENFKKLFGVPVIAKLKDDTCFVGLIDSWTKAAKETYYTSYSFTLRRIEWSDFVDERSS